MCDCNEQSGDCQLCVCGRGIGSTEAEAIAEIVLQKSDTDQTTQGIDIDSVVSEAIAQKSWKKVDKNAVILKKSNVTIGSIGEKKSVIKSLSQIVTDVIKTKQVTVTKSSSVSQTSNIKKSSTVSKSSSIQTFDAKQSTESKSSTTVQNKSHRKQLKQDINEAIIETISNRAQQAAIANRLHTSKVRYQNKATAMEKQETEVISHLSSKKKKAQETKHIREQQKKEAKERQIRTIQRSDGFIDRAEQRDEEFVKKQEAEAAEASEKLKKAAAYTMPSKAGWGKYQWILSFAGSTLLAAGIIGIVFRCLNVTLLKDSVTMAWDNVITAIVEGTQGLGGDSGEWSFGPGGSFGGGKCKPRDTSSVARISEGVWKWPRERPPIKITIPALHSSDDDEEGDFLPDDDEDIYQDVESS